MEGQPQEETMEALMEGQPPEETRLAQRVETQQELPVEIQPEQPAETLEVRVPEILPLELTHPPMEVVLQQEEIVILHLPAAVRHLQLCVAQPMRIAVL